MPILDEIRKSVVNGDRTAVENFVQQALNQGINVEEIIQNALIVAMTEVGEKFKAREIFVPEMLVAAYAMQAGLKVLEPHIVGGKRKYLTHMVIGTVKGDLHDIGKNLVGMMLEGAGVEVIDLGVNVAPEKFVEAVKEYRPAFLGLSSLLTTTMQYMRDTIEALKEAGLREQVKVVIGGAPVSQAFADQIGADGYASDASSAVDLVKSLL